MVKSEDQIFDIEGQNIKIIENESQPKKEKKKRAPLKDDEKAQLIARLKAGRERKKMERAQNVASKIIKDDTKQDTKPSPTPKLNTPQPASHQDIDLSNEIKELKKQIKETKEKQELFELKNELKELNELKQKNKNNNNNKTENVTIKKVRVVAPPILKNKTLDIQSNVKKDLVILPPKPKILKRRIR